MIEETKLDGAYIHWNHLIEKLDDSLLFLIPDEECLARFQKDFPEKGYYGHLVKSDVQELIMKGLEKSFDALRSIRENGIETHARGHSKAFLFKKVLDLYRAEFIHYPKEFKDAIHSKFDRLTNEFTNIFEVLTRNFEAIENDQGDSELSFFVNITKREKETLLRSFWDDFEKEYNQFSRHNWINEYKSLWNYQYSLYKKWKGVN